MMFLIRTAFWLAVVIMLIPVDPEAARQSAASGDARPIGAIEAASVAQAALSDAGGFCDRNPDACAIGSRIGTTFMLKARSGAEMIYNFLDEKLGAAPAAADHGTLKNTDLSPAWRGPTKSPQDI